MYYTTVSLVRIQYCSSSSKAYHLVFMYVFDTDMILACYYCIISYYLVDLHLLMSKSFCNHNNDVTSLSPSLYHSISIYFIFIYLESRDLYPTHCFSRHVTSNVWFLLRMYHHHRHRINNVAYNDIFSTEKWTKSLQKSVEYVFIGNFTLEILWILFFWNYNIITQIIRNNHLYVFDIKKNKNVTAGYHKQVHRLLYRRFQNLSNIF